MWKRLLVPHDFSPCSERALDLAVELARVHRASLILLHVSDLPPNVAPEAMIHPQGHAQTRLDRYVIEGIEQRLTDVARRAGEVPIEIHAGTGDVARLICAAAVEHRADAIVLGTHGRRGLAHLLLGSVAETVIRSAPVPVVAVGEAPLTPEEHAAEDELAG